MLPLTKNTPKPLLRAGGRPLIEHHIESLGRAGITDIVINTAKFGEQTESSLGRGEKWNINIEYSHEGSEPLGTGGGVQKALPLLGPEPFVLINGDIWTDFNYRLLMRPYDALIHLVMVDNPPQHPQGDFCLQNSRISPTGGHKLTYSGIGVFDPEFFSVQGGGMFSFVPALKDAMSQGQVTGEHYPGLWFDIGTPERLEKLNGLLN